MQLAKRVQIKTIFIMKKITMLCALCVCVLSAGAVDWTSVEWLGNGTGDEANTEMYKAVVTPELTGGANGFINNLQVFKYKDEEEKEVLVPAIHIAMPSADFGEFSLEASQYSLQGAGFFPHLDAFTAQETDFTVVCAGTTYTFTVYYKNGTTKGTGLDDFDVTPKAVKVIENGQIYILRDGVRYNILGASVQ